MGLLNILFVDDDSDELYLFNEALEHAGLQINLQRVNDGNHLISYLFSHPVPDIIFMDLNMPYKDGLEALCEIRSNPKFKELPVVIYSTTRNKDHIEECYDRGANLFIVKPNDFDEMVQIVKKVCAVNWKMEAKPARSEFVLNRAMI